MRKHFSDLIVEDFLTFEDAKLYALINVMIYLPYYTVHKEEYPDTVIWSLSFKVNTVEGKVISKRIINDCVDIVFSKNLIGWKLIAPTPSLIKREINKKLRGGKR